MNCPDSFYVNCSNAQRKCHLCTAGDGSSKLCYEPIENNAALALHPYKRNESRRKVIQRAKREELRQRERLAQLTLRSGAAKGDGDILLQDKYRVEVKDRGQKRAWNLTVSEYEKGTRQGIDIYAITNEVNGKKVTLYMMEERMLGRVLEQLEGEIDGTEEEQQS